MKDKVKLKVKIDIPLLLAIKEYLTQNPNTTGFEKELNCFFTKIVKKANNKKFWV